MKTRGNIFWALALAALLLGLSASVASADPRLALELNRDSAPTSTPVTHGDERAFYRIVVKNTALTGAVSVGDTLTCDQNDPANPTLWFPAGANHPTFTYQWLRGGTAIAAPSAVSTYTVTAADEGKALQCLVYGSNLSGASASFTPPTLVAPVPSPTAPPSPSSGTVNLRPIVTGTATKGANITCAAPATWSGVLPANWTYQWLRNGTAIPGAISATYTVTAEDVEEAPPAPTPVRSVLQCEAIATNAGGTIVAISGENLTSPAPSPPAPTNRIATNSASPDSSRLPFIVSPSKTTGEVKVEAELPGGDETYALRVLGSEPPQVLGSGWSCIKLPPAGLTHATATCTRSDTLEPESSYPPIELYERPGRDAPDLLVTKATVSGGGAADPASAEDTIGPLLPAIPFGFKAFKTEVLDSLGADFTQAGGHPFSAAASLVFNEHVPAEENKIGGVGLRAATGSVRQIRTDVPPGFVGNPQAAPSLCETMAEVTATPSTCPAASVVGSVTVELNEGVYPNLPVFAMKHEYGVPAQFAFAVEGLQLGFSLTPKLRPEDGYAISLLSSPISKNPELFAATARLCGFGAEVGVASGGTPELKVKKCLKPGEPGAFSRPFLTLPTRCGDPASTLTKIFADSWEEQGNYAEAQYSAPALTGCDRLQFEPSLKARPTTTAADSPTGLEVDLQIPQDEDPEGTATAQLKKTVVTLPEGLVVNPSGANGLGACSEAEVGMHEGVPDAGPAHCPDASKIGTVSVDTPILDHALPGALYVATPHRNPFGSLLALYLVVEDPQTGIVVKLAGKAVPDPATGQLTTSFDDNPQAPIEDVSLKIRGGASAPLRTPATCGPYATTSQLTPWSAPDSGPPATPSDSYAIEHGANGAPCVQAPAEQPNAPLFDAGVTSLLAGAHTPFVVKLAREDGSQQFSTVTLTPPPGLLAKLAGVPYCPDAALAAAAAKSGAAEQASPSCPAASGVGTVVAGAGAGPGPYYAPGKAYLSGPYKGAPISLAIVTPAVAGPFDIGTVVVRTALYVDPETARVTAVSDPLPEILEGIPLDIRSATISLDRPDFVLSPTSCDPMAVEGRELSTLGQTASLSNRFQVAECARLAFKPKLSLRLRGKTGRGGHPALRAVLTYPQGAYANTAAASVALPHSEFLEQGHIRTICTRVQFAADQCPAGAAYGKATVTTPLLDRPLQGPVYLRSSSHPLPDLVIDLRGQIHVALVGRIDSVHGGIRTSFEATPDAPVSKVVLEMQGGKKGLLVNSRDICRSTNRATVRFSAQNGKVAESRPPLRAKCGGGSGGKRRQRGR